MGYSTQTRVLHINDVAHVGTMMIGYARNHGRQWALQKIPAGTLSFPSIKARLDDLINQDRKSRYADIVHIHYAPNGYYGWSFPGPVVLHFHGTDLRQDLHQPVKRQLIQLSLRKAAAVVYATPDMKDEVKQLDDRAIYLPNPAPQAILEKTYPEYVKGRIIFNMRWDDSKGGLGLVSAAEKLVSLGYEVCGVDWGTYRNEASQAGVKLLPLMNSQDFSNFLATGQIIVGQLLIPALGISDMQSLATGRPVLMGAQLSDAPIVEVNTESLARKADSIMKKEPSADQASSQIRQQRHWLQEHHSEEQCLEEWENLYRRLLSRK